MKHSISRLVIIGLMFYQTANAQDISKLTLPASPAFSILDFEPSAVMHPTNVKSLATDILSSFDQNGKLLMNLGLEASPYWLGSHPNLKMKTYLNPNLGQTIIQSFSLSAATVKDSVSGENKLGAGFRFKLYNGAPAKNTELAIATADLKTMALVASIINGAKNTIIAGDTKQNEIDKIESALNAKKVNQLIIDDFKNVAEKLKGDYSDSISDIQDFLEKLLKDRVEAYNDLQIKVSDLLYQRKGFVVELAGASGYNTSKNNSLEKIGFWGNASYYVSPDDLFTFTARYMFNNHDTTVSNFDAGLSFLKKTDKFNISVEAILRYYRAEIPDIDINNLPIMRLEKKTTYRLAFQGAYNISDFLSLNVSFGKDFDLPIISKSAFFSILGLNYSIFNKEISKLASTQ